MKKHFFLIIGAMMLLVPIAAYSKTATDMTDHTPIDRSKTDTYSDGMTDQPMTDMKDMRSDKMMDKSKTDIKSNKKTKKSITGTKSKKKMGKSTRNVKSDKMVDKPITDMKSGETRENK